MHLDRLVQPSDRQVGVGQVGAAGERGRVVGAHRGLADVEGLPVQVHSFVIQAQPGVSLAQGVEQRPPGRPGHGEIPVEPRAGPVEDFGHLHLFLVHRRVRAAERLHQELAHRLGLLPRLLRLLQGRLGLALRLTGRFQRSGRVALGLLEPIVGLRLDGGHGPQPDHAGHQRHQGRGHGRSVPMPPSPGPDRDRLAPRRHRLVGQPSHQVVAQGACRVVAILGARRQRLEADRLQGPR